MSAVEYRMKWLSSDWSRFASGLCYHSAGGARRPSVDESANNC